jgi:hypothetical protein
MMRRNRVLITLAVLVPVTGVGLGAIYLYWANQVPSYPRTPIVMPKPNARDDYIAAGRMCQAVHGSQVLGPTGTPLLRNGQLIHASDPGVSPVQMRAVVSRNQPALARLRVGLHKRYANPPVQGVDDQFPELSAYRELARVLVAEGKLAEEAGRMREAARSYLDCLRMGSEEPHGGAVIHGLVGIAIQTIGLRPLQGAVGRMDGPTAAATAREMLRLETNTPSLADTLTWEKDALTTSMTRAFFQRPKQQPPAVPKSEGASSPTPAALSNGWGLRLLPKKWIMDNMRGYLDRLITATRRASYTGFTPPPLPPDPLSRILVPVYLEARSRWAQREAYWRITLLRLAARAYQQRHGTFPPSASALVPAYLPAVPLDPYASSPLVCRLENGQPLIYSRGPDGDDDGGRKDLGVRADPESDGDIVTMQSIKRQ